MQILAVCCHFNTLPFGTIELITRRIYIKNKQKKEKKKPQKGKNQNILFLIGSTLVWTTKFHILLIIWQDLNSCSQILVTAGVCGTSNYEVTVTTS